MIELIKNSLLEVNVAHALALTSVVWVLLSWVKLVITPNTLVYKMLCLKCVTFWFVLIATQNPFTAATAALMAMLIEGIVNNFKVNL